MSMAPVPWLRKWWSLGGAPAAFMQRDAALTRACERLLAQGDPAPTLEANASYATLIATLDLSNVLAPELDAPRDEGQRVFALRDPRRGLESSSSAGVVAKRMPRSASFDAQPRLAPSPSSMARPTGGPRSRETAETDRTSSSESKDATLTRVPTRLTGSGSDRAQKTDRVRSSPEWMSKDVATVRCRASSELTARVNQVLNELTESAPSAAAAKADQQANAIQQPDSAPWKPSQLGDRLARIVQRVEQRFAERERVSSSAAWNSGESARHSDHAPTSMRPPAADWRSPMVAGTNAARPHVESRSTGLRGLAERASFMGVRHNAGADSWPDAELDRFSTLLNSVARQEGVALEEGLS